MLGKKLKEAIEKSPYSTEEIAAKIEMSAVNLYRLYKKDSFEVKYLQQIADILGLPITSFFGEEAPGVYQAGIGNNTGKIKNQKIMQSGNVGEPAENLSNVTELQAKLQVCEAEKAGLEKLLASREEMIEVLKGRQ